MAEGALRTVPPSFRASVVAGSWPCKVVVRPCRRSTADGAGAMHARAAPVRALLSLGQAARRSPIVRKSFQAHQRSSLYVEASKMSLAKDIAPATIVQKGPSYRTRGQQLTEHRFSVRPPSLPVRLSTAGPL